MCVHSTLELIGKASCEWETDFGPKFGPRDYPPWTLAAWSDNFCPREMLSATEDLAIISMASTSLAEEQMINPKP